jgi:CTP:molybdopterin cytidylyltransferase MocA
VSVAAVVLAAGASQRLGRPKQRVEINGERLVARAVRIAHEAGLNPVIAVIADPTLREALQALGASVLHNPEASEGIASSIRIGIDGARSFDVSGAIVMTCDQVAVTANHLRSLCELPESAAGSAYAGAIGVPAYFPVRDFEDLLKLRGDRGARDLLQNARAVVIEELSLDIDTEEDLEHARKLLEREEFP